MLNDVVNPFCVCVVLCICPVFPTENYLQIHQRALLFAQALSSPVERWAWSTPAELGSDGSLHDGGNFATPLFRIPQHFSAVHFAAILSASGNKSQLFRRQNSLDAYSQEFIDKINCVSYRMDWNSSCIHELFDQVRLFLKKKVFEVVFFLFVFVLLFATLQMVLQKKCRSVSIAVTTYDRTFLQNQPDKEAIRFRATAILFLIHFFSLSMSNGKIT